MFTPVFTMVNVLRVQKENLSTQDKQDENGPVLSNSMMAINNLWNPMYFPSKFQIDGQIKLIATNFNKRQTASDDLFNLMSMYTKHELIRRRYH